MVKIVRIILENVGILRPKRDLEDFTLFDIDPKVRKCPSAKCPSAADASGNYIGIWDRYYEIKIIAIISWIFFLFIRLI